MERKTLEPKVARERKRNNLEFIGQIWSGFHSLFNGYNAGDGESCDFIRSANPSLGGATDAELVEIGFGKGYIGNLYARQFGFERLEQVRYFVSICPEGEVEVERRLEFVRSSPVAAIPKNECRVILQGYKAGVGVVYDFIRENDPTLVNQSNKELRRRGIGFPKVQKLYAISKGFNGWPDLVNDLFEDQNR